MVGVAQTPKGRRGLLVIMAVHSTRLAVAAVMRGRFLSTGAVGTSKVYELRRYAVRPSKMRECMGVLEEVLAMRARFSKMNGCWSTELGGLNELHFLWEFGVWYIMLPTYSIS